MASVDLGAPLKSFIPAEAQQTEKLVVPQPGYTQNKMTVQTFDRTGDGEVDALVVHIDRPEGNNSASVHLLEAGGRVDLYDRDGDGQVDKFTRGTEGDGEGWRYEAHTRHAEEDEIRTSRRRTAADPIPMITPSQTVDSHRQLGPNGRPQRVITELRNDDRHPDRHAFNTVIPGGALGFMLNKAKIGL